MSGTAGDTEATLDFGRDRRIGLEEAVFAAGKSVAQIATILDMAADAGRSMLVTRLSTVQYEVLPDRLRSRIDYCDSSRTAFFGAPHDRVGPPRVAVVCAGTSDIPVAREALRTLQYHGHDASLFADVGVAGLWRLTSRIDEIRRMPVAIVVAGMDAALASVAGGLLGGVIYAVPTSVGYGVATGGQTALNAMLASCAPGVAVFNIDNGYGAACAAMRTLNVLDQAHRARSS